ncbi:hypothetical protein [Burkholderia ubonensis]|uniref:hypothetical protein n=1 Tax=Burkholderia ubonensis TaxID=101571 RepID=UPI00075F2BCE|nr:hypothetical protein [Burkholderia ubonensis]KVV07307.1 hypothetical protein WK77_16070 [Burkholderia ubonensis]
MPAEQSDNVEAVPPLGAGKESFSSVASERMIPPRAATSTADIGWKGRKVCSVMKVVSALMSAVATSPGGGSSAEDIAAAATTLLARATELADAATPLLGVGEASPQFPALRNALREGAADTISMQWRLAHATGMRELTVSQIADIYRSVKEADFIPDTDLEASDAPVTDPVVARRLALFGATTEIHNAVTAFGYFHPQPDNLVAAGLAAVVSSCDRAIERILSSGEVSAATRAAVEQTLIERAGLLYAQNYRAVANRDIKMLSMLDPEERMCRVREHRATGMPTAHIDEAFTRLMDRMVDMVIESAPELSNVEIPSTDSDSMSSQEIGVKA